MNCKCNNNYVDKTISVFLTAYTPLANPNKPAKYIDKSRHLLNIFWRNVVNSYKQASSGVIVGNKT